MLQTCPISGPISVVLCTFDDPIAHVQNIVAFSDDQVV